ncbi:MAG: flagellar biosynthesis protein FlgB, partial [Acetobacteraceae bacterium]|nr:flagellar biosynthesis protein FlgB [Acetobacteraceae bacterium]
MDLSQLGLFDLAQRRLTWAAQRQTVLADNIANVSTPGFQAKDLTPFANTLTQALSAEPVQTQPNHLKGTTGGALQAKKDIPAARAVDGNDVALDVQLTKVADTETIQATVTTIFRKYMSLFSVALGR